MKRKKELIVILSSLLVIVLSVSVAYFTTKILGTGKEISVESADLKVIFTSGSGTINGSNIEPGWSSGENTFTVKNESNGTYKYNIIIKDLVNTFVTEGFLQYKITSTDGGYNMTDFADVPKSSTSANVALARNITIGKDATHTYTVVFKYLESEDVDQSTDMGKTLSGKLFITEVEQFKGGTLSEAIMFNNPTISTRNDFSVIFTSNTPNTLYKATENSTDVYYFAGQDTASVPVNNWVKFGQAKSFSKCTFNGNTVGYFINVFDIKEINLTEEECLSSGKIMSMSIGGQTAYFTGTEENLNTFYEEAQSEESLNVEFVEGTLVFEAPKVKDTYWRIIRTNSDGSIRLLFSGSGTNQNDAYIGTSVFTTFESSTSNAEAVSYMYGNEYDTMDKIRANTNSSEIKTVIDDWYKSNFTAYTNYLSNDAIYCNDREIASGNTYSSDVSYSYKAYERLFTNKSPSYNCANIKDAFSSSNTEAKLVYPIALMTGDEIAYAGGVADTEAPMWYYTNSNFENITGGAWWWTMTPANKMSSSYQNVMSIEQPNYFSYHGTDCFDESPLYVRPVTSLKSCVQWKSGDGAANNPYEIEMNGVC